MALDHLLKEARKARLADDYDSAIKLCRAYLDVHPASPDGESLLGLCEIECGRPEGEARIVKAAEAAPKSAAAQLNLSILRERQGDIRNAVVHASSAATLDRSFEAWAQLGKLLGKGEKFDEAFSALEQAMKLRRDHPGVMMLFAAAALETGRLDVCAAALDDLETLGVPKADTRRLRAHMLRKRGDATALEEFAAGWLQEAPNETEARVALAYALAERGYYDKAATAFAPLAASARASADDFAAMGRYKLGARRLDEAAHWFKRALKADSVNAEASFGLARRSMFLGRMDEAEAWCRRTLEAAPGHADALGVLLEATGGKISDADFSGLDAALRVSERQPDVRVKLLFAKGDALHARKQYDAAFAAWAEANALKRERAQGAGAAYDRRAQAEKTGALIRLFPGDAPARAPGGAGAPTPIFIVGMPRSGTTLLESALCAHPDIDGAGEVPAMPFFLDEFLAWSAGTGGGFEALPQGEIDQWRAGYLEQCERFGWTGARFVTDKQPSNFLSAGMIVRLYPDARIIHIRRDPVETGFSIFRRNFTQQWPFTTDLADIAHYYAEHERIARHWLKSYSEQMTFVQYEDLVRDFEPELRRLVAFCGLDWSEDCLRFHEQTRSVMTFSAAQVREPPSLARLSSTGPYRDHLKPLIGALDDFGVDLDTGALRTRH